jgi:hypothetical protein
MNALRAPLTALSTPREEVCLNFFLDMADDFIDGNRYGERWSGIGGRCVGTGRVPDRGWAHCIWRKHCRIVGGGGARETFEMPNVW